MNIIYRGRFTEHFPTVDDLSESDRHLLSQGVRFFYDEAGRDFWKVRDSFSPSATIVNLNDENIICNVSQMFQGFTPLSGCRIYELSGPDIPNDIHQLSGKILDLDTGSLVDPPPPVPASITRRQFYTGLALRKLISEDEAFAAVGDGGNIPARLQTFIDGITDPAEKFSAKMLLAGADIHRDHPLTEKVARGIGWAAPAVDDFFRFCATL